MGAGKQKWKAVAYHPKSGTHLSEEGDGGSSQYAELKAVTLPLDPHDHTLRLFTCSWAVVNVFVVWIPDWQKNNWLIHDRPVWGKQLCQLLWDASHHHEITVYPVDAHTNVATNMAQHNAVADQLATISRADTVHRVAI
ncbi:ribonuclease H-like [Narcine bancroftii]|uniref:ribonuclease H-like n=1 Tax=Narcine bancroftii TaxID=1343680 RepID=UPI0038320797